MDDLEKLHIRDLVASLPAGERDLARLLMAGHTQATAARELGVSTRTVRRRVRRLRRKLAA